MVVVVVLGCTAQRAKLFSQLGRVLERKRAEDGGVTELGR